MQTLTDCRFPSDQAAREIGGRDAALVVTVVHAGFPKPEHAGDRETLRQDSKTVGRVEAADPRVAIYYDWPFPQAVYDIAEALSITERAVYKIIARFNRELAAIRAEQE